MGFWSGLEGKLLALQQDRERAARYFRVAWWISSAFVLVGVLVVFLIATGVWRP